LTKIQRLKHINDLNTILEQAGATIDRWGMYHIGEYKFDTRETNLKVYKAKNKISSQPMTKISILDFQNYISRISSKNQ